MVKPESAFSPPLHVFGTRPDGKWRAAPAPPPVILPFRGGNFLPHLSVAATPAPVVNSAAPSRRIPTIRYPAEAQPEAKVEAPALRTSAGRQARRPVIRRPWASGPDAVPLSFARARYRRHPFRSEVEGRARARAPQSAHGAPSSAALVPTRDLRGTVPDSVRVMRRRLRHARFSPIRRTTRPAPKKKPPSTGSRCFWCAFGRAFGCAVGYWISAVPRPHSPAGSGLSRSV